MCVGQELLGERAMTESSGGADDLWWLARSYALFSIAGLTPTVIPYDAFGQDLARDPSSRAKLFGMKASFQFCAILSSVLMILVLSIAYPSSLHEQVKVLTTMGASFVGPCGAFLLLVVREPTTSHSPIKGSRENKGDAVTVIRSLGSNSPFIEYLFIRVLVAVAFHLPSSQLVYYLKYSLHTENSVKSSAIIQMSYIPLIALALSMVNRWLKTTPARKVWRGVICFFAIVHLLVSLLPSEVIRTYHVLNLTFPLYWPLLTSSTLVVPSLMLADILDYDQLRSGMSRQAMYITFDHSIIQALDILVGSIPALTLSSNGFLGNGGCSCGCGVSCPLTYLRWSCPDDIGFACSNALDASNTPFFGSPSRVPPCLLQKQRVLVLFDVMMFYIPSLCCGVAVGLLSTYSITTTGAMEIHMHLERRRKGLNAYDPVRNENICTTGATAIDILGQEERELFYSRGFAVVQGKIRRDVLCGASLVVLLFLVSRLDAALGVVAVAAIPVVVVIVWSMLKYKVASSAKGRFIAMQLSASPVPASATTKSSTEAMIKKWVARSKGRKHEILAPSRRSRTSVG